MECSKAPAMAADAASAVVPGRRGSNRRRRRRCCPLVTDLAPVAVIVLALLALAVALACPLPCIYSGSDKGFSASNLASKLLHHLSHMPVATAMALRSLAKAGTLAALALPSATSASLLYVSSYAGTITTFNLSLATLDHATEASLQVVASTTGCAPNPSWLTLDYPNSTVYCLDEGLSSRNGTLSSYRTTDNGTLVQLDKVDTIVGPVSAAIYGTENRGLVLAQ